MKLTPTLVRQVQQDIDDFGLQTALFNLLYLAASEQLIDLGVRRIQTEQASLEVEVPLRDVSGALP